MFSACFILLKHHLSSIIALLMGMALALPSNQKYLTELNMNLDSVVLSHKSPFESTDDSVYQDVDYLEALVADYQHLRLRLTLIGLPPSSPQDILLYDPSYLSEATDEQELNLYDHVLATKIRTRLNILKKSSAEMLDSINSLNRMKNRDLVRLAEESTLQKLNEKLQKGVNVQDALCLSLSDLTEKGETEELLRTVKVLYGQKVTLQQVHDMHAIVQFVEKFHGTFINDSIAIGKNRISPQKFPFNNTAEQRNNSVKKFQAIKGGLH